MACPFFLSATSNQCIGQTTANTFRAYQETLNLEFERSRKTLAQSPPTPIPFFDSYTENLNDVLELFFTEDKTLYEKYRPNEKKRLQKIKNSEAETPYQLYFQAEIKLQWAFIKLKYGDQWSAAWSLRNAYQLILKNHDDFPDFIWNQKTLGLLHVIFGAVPTRYHWVLGLFGMKGNVIQGARELNDLLQTEESPLEMETRMLLAMIHAYLLEQHEQSVKLLENGMMSEPSRLYTYLYALVHMKAHQSEKAHIALSAALNKQNEHKKLAYYHYLLAEVCFQKGQYVEALQQYSLFIENFSGKNNLKDAWLKKSLCHQFLGDNVGFQHYLSVTKNSGTTYGEADKNAQKLILSQPFPNVELIKIRYAIDGGFYRRADSLMSLLSAKDLLPSEKIELSYRKARRYQLSKNYEKALTHYQAIMINADRNTQSYFIPNSFLQAGYIQLIKGDTLAAKNNFEEVLSFKKHAYKNSLDTKAKIALKSINEAR